MERKKHSKNSKDILPFFLKEKPVQVPVCTSTIPVVTPTKELILKICFWTIRLFYTGIRWFCDVRKQCWTYCTYWTHFTYQYIEIIPVYDVNNPKPSWNNPKPSWIEETQTEDILPDMNRFYGIPMGIEQEILNNQSQFNKQIKERFNKALI